MIGFEEVWTDHWVEPLDDIVSATDVIKVVRCWDQNALATKLRKLITKAFKDFTFWRIGNLLNLQYL